MVEDIGIVFFSKYSILFIKTDNSYIYATIDIFRLSAFPSHTP